MHLCLRLSDTAVAAQMLARMKQDMGSTPKVSEAPQDEPLLPQPAPGQPGQPGHARKPSLGADATPRGGHARRKSLVSGVIARPCRIGHLHACGGDGVIALRAAEASILLLQRFLQHDHAYRSMG